MPTISEIPAEAKACVDYAVRAVIARCLSHPRLDADPTPVLANERDKFLDELWRAAPVEVMEVKNWAETNGNGRNKRATGRLGSR